MSPRRAIPDLPEGLDEGWKNGENPVVELASVVGRALVKGTDEALVPFGALGLDLAAAGNDYIARLLGQAMLIRLTHPDLNKDSPLSDWLADGDAYREMAVAVSSNRNADPRLRAEALTLVARVAMSESDYELATRALEGAIDGWTRLELWENVGNAYMGRGAAFAYEGRLSDAERMVAKATEVFERIGDFRGIAMVSLNNVQNALSNGDLALAETRLELCRPLVMSLRDGHITTSFQLTEGLVLIEKEQFEAARRCFVEAATNAARRGESGQLVVALKNVAKVTSEHGSARRALYWWQKARDAASAAHDWREEQSIERTLGVSLADADLFETAVEAFQRAIRINDDRGDELGSAQAKADQGATLLSWSVHERRQGNEDSSASLLIRAESTIDDARLILERFGDFHWAEITVRNLRGAFAGGDHPEVGVAAFLSAAEEFARVDPNYSAELLRNAALLRLTESTDANVDEAITWILTAARRELTTKEQKAWSLASDAGLLTDIYELHAPAVRLFDEALKYLSRTGQPTAWGNIMNSAALAATADADLTGAKRRLTRVADLARGSENRVLLALAQSNLGELAIRRHEYLNARTLFSEASELAQQLGDNEQAANALASIANAWVAEGNAVEAANAAAAAELLARESSSNDALARANSARASIAYLLGEFEEAYAWWQTSAQLAELRSNGEYHAFALDSLAKLGDWPRFKHELDKVAAKSQREGSQLAFVDKLHLSASSWLGGGRPRAAGVVLAYIVLLGLDGTIKARTEAANGVGGQTAQDRALFNVTQAFGAAYAYLRALDLPSKDATTLRRGYESTVRRVAKDSADDVLSLVDDFISDETDDET